MAVSHSDDHIHTAPEAEPVKYAVVAVASGEGLVETFIPDVTNLLKGLWDGAVNSVKALFMPKDERSDDEKRQAAQDAAQEGFAMASGTGTAKTIQKLIAAKITRGTSVPYLRGQRALLTGEPVGDWHLTIGNPFNPIAMIGNLVVKDLSIEFYDEQSSKKASELLQKYRYIVYER